MVPSSFQEHITQTQQRSTIEMSVCRILSASQGLPRVMCLDISQSKAAGHVERHCGFFQHSHLGHLERRSFTSSAFEP